MNQPDYLNVPKQFPPDWVSAYGQDAKGYWIELSIYDETVCFRWIPKGQFTMGSDKNEKGRYGDEDQHIVKLSQGFWLTETTVTQALWQAVMGENPSHFQEGSTNNFPVERVSWDDVQKFIKTLNQLYPDWGVRLPWEAEWEYACRTGTETAFNFEGELTLDKVNYRGTWDDYGKWGKGAKEATTEVKSYPCNAWGLYEMHGNVWEWCEDVWHDNLGTEEVSDPWSKGSQEAMGDARVVRGGSWIDRGRFVRSAFRHGLTPGGRGSSIGFRLSLGL